MRKFLCLIFIVVIGSFVTAQNALVLNGAYVRMNGGSVANPIYLVVNQPQATGIIRPGGGHIHSENQYNLIRWITSTNTGNYIFPFGVAGTAADYIPFEFNKITTGNSNVTVSTYSTNSGNIPFATPVSAMAQALSSIDRFWDIRSTTTVTANLTFRYRGIENTIATCATDTLKSQYWNNPGGPWSSMFGPGNPGVAAGIGTVGSIPNQSYFQSTETVWALTSIPISPTITASSSITCNGSNNGSATVTTAGGLGPYTFSWSPSAITSSVATGLTPGIHTVIVTGNNACSSTKTVTISQPPAISVTVSQSQVTCTSLASVTLTPSGGTPTYTAYTWSPAVSATNTASGLSAGNYTATVVDNNGCPKATTITVTSNTIAPSVAASASGSLNCTTASTTVVASTTTSPVSYNWTGPGVTGGATTGTATVNAGGTYNYTVTNSGNGCNTTGTVSVIQNTTVPTVGAAASNSLNCTALTAQVTSTTVAAPVTYSWTGPGITGGATTASATVNAAGNYNYTVTNTSNNCKTTGTVSVIQNTTTPTVGAAASNSLNCTALTAQVTSTTVAAPVTYSWTGPGITGGATTASATVNAPGTYNYTVTNTFNNCTTNGSVSVIQNTTAPTASATVIGTITCASPSVQLVGSSTPAGTCTVAWTGGVCAGPTSYTATACSAGTYTFIATNPSNNCPSSPAVVVVNPNTNVPTVSANNTGTITCLTTSVQVVATTTASPVSYVWSGAGITGGAGTPTITVNAGGTYTAIVTNTVTGCSSTVTNSVTANNAVITPTATASNTITCNTTTISLTTGAGAGVFNYNWSGPGIVSSNTLATITASLGGSYTATVTNISSGCFGTVSIAAASNTTVPTSVIVTPSNFTLSCATPTTQLVVTTTGGSTYTWTPPVSGSVLSGVNSTSASVSGPGIYTVVVTGTNGCSAPPATATLVADANSPAVTLSANSASITCLVSAPSVTATPTGTVTIASYSWSPASGISSGSNTTTPTFTTAGTYSCLITAGNGCTTTTFVTIANNSIIPTATSPTVNSITCSNINTNINPIYTPTAGLTYTWTGASILGSTTSASVNVDQSGTYTVSFVDPSNGCSNTMTVSVTGNTVSPTATVVSSSTIGIGCSPSTSTVTLTGSSTPSTGVNYNWSDGSTVTAITINTPGVYSLTVIDPINNCSVTTQFTVANNTVTPNVNAGANGALPCGAAGTYTLNGSSTTSGVTYTWSGPGIVSGINTPSAVINTAGNYTLTVSDPTTGCVSSSTVNISVTVVNATFTPSQTSGINPLTVNFANGSTGASTYSWVFGNGSVSTSTNPSTVYQNSGVFTVQLIAFSGPCSDTAYATINVDDGLTIEIPNVFTPNDDGTNDFLTIKSTGVKELTLEIFNRWGQKMYEFTGVKCAWDGVSSSGNKVPSGTYFYFVKATGFDDKEITRNGPVSLFR